MLQPKRTKFRKQQKGRNRGLAHRGASVSFGEYGLKATGSNGKANQTGNTIREFSVDRDVMDKVYLDLVDGDVFCAFLWDGYKQKIIVDYTLCFAMSYLVTLTYFQ